MFKFILILKIDKLIYHHFSPSLNGLLNWNHSNKTLWRSFCALSGQSWHKMAFLTVSYITSVLRNLHSGQPVWSSHTAFPRLWPLNTGSTVIAFLLEGEGISRNRDEEEYWNGGEWREKWKNKGMRGKKTILKVSRLQITFYQCMWNSTSAALGYTRVEFDDKQIPLIKILVVKKEFIKINAILYKFGQGLKFAPKLTYNKLYSPDVSEDGGIQIS